MSKIVRIGTEARFESEVLGAAVPALVTFYTPECPDCQRYLKTFDTLHNEYGEDVRFVTVDVAECPELEARYEIGRLPTVILFRGGEVSYRWLEEQDIHVYRTALESMMQHGTI